MLEGSAELAKCFAGGNASAAIAFSWENTARVALPAASPTPAQLAAPLPISASGGARRDLALVGAVLEAGVRYTLTLRGCMASDASVCGQASTDVGLRDEPLQATIADGDRSVGETSGFELSACASADPDDAAARCVRTTQLVATAPPTSHDCGSLRFSWACVAAGGAPCAAAPPSGGLACAWPVGASTLPAGTYEFNVTVSKASGVAEQASASVRVTVLAGARPKVSIGPLVYPKQNPSSRLAVRGAATLPAEAASNEGACVCALCLQSICTASPDISRTDLVWAAPSCV